MATDLERLVVSLDADIRKFDSSLRRAVATFNGETKKVEARAKQMQRNVNSSFADLGKTLAAGFSTAAIASGIMAFKNLSDAATRTENSLRVAGLSGAELTNVYSQLFAAAQQNATPIEELVQLYSRASLSQKDLGASTQRMITFSTNVAKALRVQGGSVEAARGALLQLSQALGGGVVRAEEFNSIQEGALPILQAVAAGLSRAGGSVAELRRIMLAGQLTSKEFFDAFERGAPLLDEKLKNSVLTIDQSLVQLRNSLQDTVGKIDDVTGASNGAVYAIGLLSKAIDSVGNAVTAGKAGEGSVSKFAEEARKAGEIMRFLLLEFNAFSTAAQKAMDDAAKSTSGVNPVVKTLERDIKALQERISLNTELGFDNTEALARLKQMQHELAKLRSEAAKPFIIAPPPERATFVDPRPATAVRDTSIYSETLKRDEFFEQRNAESMKTELEKNVDTRAKAIIEAAEKVGISLSEAAAKIQARSEIAAETSVATNAKAASSTAELIKGFESFRSSPYWDVNAYRVGYGSDTITLADGTIQKVVQGMKVSVADANRDLDRRIVEFQNTIRDQIGSDTFGAMNENQQAALTSIAYNYGSLPERLVAAIRTGSTESVYNAIRGLRTDNGGINAGRRDQEAQLYLTGASPTLTKSIESKESFAEKLAEQQRALQQLKEETGLRATLNPLLDDHGQKLTTLQKAQELFNLAQQEGTAAGRELTSATQLLSGDLSALTPEARAQAEAMRALATQYGQTAAAAEQLKASQEAAAKSSTESLELAKSVTGGILSDIRSALSDGKITWKEWGEIAVNALNKVADKLQEMLLNQLFSPTGGLGSLFGGLGSVFTPNTTLGGFLGFSKGGYTGPGGKYQPAGVVHKGEYVFDADAVKRLGVANLEALRGYAKGGLVGRMPRAIAAAASPEIHVVVDDEGSLRAYVQREGRRTEARIAMRSKAEFDDYRRNGFHEDAANHSRNPRRRG